MNPILARSCACACHGVHEPVWGSRKVQQVEGFVGSAELHDAGGRWALAAHSGDEQRIVFIQLCNVLDPRVAVDFSSASQWLRVPMQALLWELRADHEVASALCLKMGMRSCKELREAKVVDWDDNVHWTDLETLGPLSSVLSVLEELHLAQGVLGVQRLAEELGTGALPAVTTLTLNHMHVGDTGALALAAALGRGALPALKPLALHNAAISDAGLVALAPALRRLPALEDLYLGANPLGNEGLAALVAPPPPPADALSPPTGVLAELKRLNLKNTQVSDAGCAALVAAIDSGLLSASFEFLGLDGDLPSGAVEPVHEALARAAKAKTAALVAKLAALEAALEALDGGHASLPLRRRVSRALAMASWASGVAARYAQRPRCAIRTHFKAEVASCLRPVNAVVVSCGCYTEGREALRREAQGVPGVLVLAARCARAVPNNAHKVQLRLSFL